MTDCAICPILASRNNGEDVIVFETTHWRVVLADDQRTLGRCFVTLREHAHSVSELTTEQWRDLHEVMQRLEVNLERAFSPSHVNWSCLMNDAIVTGQPTHVHWHLHPRYRAPVEFAGEVFHDTELYAPKERTAHPVSRDVLLQIAHVLV